jgi:hypothetical protein
LVEEQDYWLLCMTTMCAVLGYGQSAWAVRVKRPPAATATKVASTGSSSAVQRALLDQYCVTCHNDKTKKANLTLENLDLNMRGITRNCGKRSFANFAPRTDATAGSEAAARWSSHEGLSELA